MGRKALVPDYEKHGPLADTQRHKCDRQDQDKAASGLTAKGAVSLASRHP